MQWISKFATCKYCQLGSADYISKTSTVFSWGSKCTHQCYAPLPPTQAIVRQGGDLKNINCLYVQIARRCKQVPMKKVEDLTRTV